MNALPGLAGPNTSKGFVKVSSLRRTTLCPSHTLVSCAVRQNTCILNLISVCGFLMVIIQEVLEQF